MRSFAFISSSQVESKILILYICTLTTKTIRLRIFLFRFFSKTKRTSCSEIICCFSELILGSTRRSDENNPKSELIFSILSEDVMNDRKGKTNKIISKGGNCYMTFIKLSKNIILLAFIVLLFFFFKSSHAKHE